jgi:4-hydroxyproline epimerase
VGIWAEAHGGIGHIDVEGDAWRQESIVGSIFEGHVRVRDGHLYPFIKGMAHINAEANLVLTEADPFCWGIRP